MAPRTVSDEELLDLLYGATGDPPLWPEFLAALVRRVGGRIAALISHNPTSGRYPLVINVGADPELQRRYEEYYGAKDPWVIAGQQKLVEGWVERGSSLCPPSQVVRTEFYNDFYRFYPHFYPLGAIVEQRGADRSFLTIMRDRSQDDFSDSEVAFVRSLFPHLQRALKLYRKIMDLKRTASAAGSVLNAFDIAFIGTDERGNVLFSNHQAELLLRTCKVLTVKDGKLTALDPRENTALGKLLKTACSPRLNGEPDGAITLHDMGRSLHLSVLPFTSEKDIFPSRPHMLVVITDPEALPKSREHTLTSLFRLTAAENRVTGLLLAGLDPREIAARTRTTQNTVRSHLKSVYGKTGVSRQSHLIRLVSKIPGNP